jgi:PI-3-kinase-related kinase SMG-1
LNFNFHTIILPEALKTIQTEEPTVLAMVNELDNIIAGVGCPLEDLLAQLEMHLRYTIMEMDVSFMLKLLRERMHWVINPLKTKRMFYIRTQCVPHCKHAPLRL